MLERIRPVLVLIAVLWLVTAVDVAFDLELVRFGIRPRDTGGLVGILLAPFLHAGFPHLIANTVPLLLLGVLAVLGQRHGLVAITAPIVVLGGLATWGLASDGIHVGASGIVFGWFGYVVARGVYGLRLGQLLLAVIAAALYGGIVYGVLPNQPGISWEGHLGGLVAGFVTGRSAGRELARERAHER
jgi:membrane associated rhomboid family serine protease